MGNAQRKDKSKGTHKGKGKSEGKGEGKWQAKGKHKDACDDDCADDGLHVGEGRQQGGHSSGAAAAARASVADEIPAFVKEVVKVGNFNQRGAWRRAKKEPKPCCDIARGALVKFDDKGDIGHGFKRLAGTLGVVTSETIGECNVWSIPLGIEAIGVNNIELL